MKLKVELYPKEMIGEVKAFNSRLQQKKGEFTFPETHVSDRWPNKDDGRKIFEDYYLVTDETNTVRGGYILKTQEFYLNGEQVQIGNIQLPLSEGTINKAYNLVGLKIVSDATKKSNMLYALGMGGINNPFPLFLKSMGWKLLEVPFYFKVCNPTSFLRNINILRKNTLRKTVLDFLALSGLGWIGHKLFLGLQSLRKKSTCNYTYSVVNEFGEWSDNLWLNNRKNFFFIGTRDSRTLNILYPAENRAFIRLKIETENGIIAWALVLVTQMSENPFFGNMLVGSLIDCFYSHGSVEILIAAIGDHFNEQKVDLIISNQAHSDFKNAFTSFGYLQGPSNFIFAASKKLAKALQLNEQTLGNIHMNRGDGDGPMHL